ncbi:MAG: anaerobic ribonucleoside-triphosphate reductase activating protein [Candidatus Omnitrophica bacterium]|nr:anaerobic ribonucleoside-triphosphate reductase activating protein [Candidatus Omnitrophota bacterium]MDD5725442.1 anaerobic ribonucleoside-triphosphate reductase activating protein [Candidatus Omnitrophota bacterium]
MKIGGFVKSSLIDYPGKVAAVIFTQGCNFRCPYCHNSHLVYPERFEEGISFEEILSFLEKRRGLIEGVVFCGGEPTLQEDLAEKILEVRSLGYAVKLDTNGSRPEILAEVLPFLDYLAMDIKAPFGPEYETVCGVKTDDRDVRRSMLLVRAAGVSYEFRTTVDPRFMPPGSVDRIRDVVGKNEAYHVREAVITER